MCSHGARNRTYTTIDRRRPGKDERSTKVEKIPHAAHTGILSVYFSDKSPSVLNPEIVYPDSGRGNLISIAASVKSRIVTVEKCYDFLTISIVLVRS